MSRPTRFPTELIKGTSELLVLAALRAGPRHGYGLIQTLRERSGGRLQLNEGAIYPLLHRLQRERKVRVRDESTGRRVRKVYELTAAGRRALAAAAEQFGAFTDCVQHLVAGTDSETERGA